MSQSYDPVLKYLVSNMKNKYDKYWGSIEKSNLMIFIVIVLNPRCKFNFFQFWFKKIYGDKLVKKMITKVKQLIINMYRECRFMYGSSSGISYSEPPSSIDLNIIDFDSQQNF